MIKIWAKIMSNEKIITQTTLEIDTKKSSFFDMLKDTCVKLNIPTPVLLEKHVYDFNLFHMTTFKPFDFIEAINFDKFVIELINQ